MKSTDLSRPTAANSQYTIQLQQYLRALSYEYKEIPTVAVNGIFDNQTEEAVKAFQTLSNLNPTGEADTITWKRLREKYLEVQESNLRPFLFDAFPSSGEIFTAGDFHPSIYSVQYAFQTLSRNYDNFIEGEFTGFIDDTTARNITELRKIAVLPEGNYLDKDLWNILVLVHNSMQRK